MHIGDEFITAGTTTNPIYIEALKPKCTEFGIKIRDRNIIFFSYMEEQKMKGILFMLGEKDWRWNNVKGDLKENGYCIHLSTGKDLGDMCERCCDRERKCWIIRYGMLFLNCL